MTELTPRDDIKKKVSEILKRVDGLIRAADIDQAMREIIRAKEIDPRNVYIFAYEERLTYLKEEHEKHAQQEQTRKEAEEAAQRRDEEARRRADEELRRHQLAGERAEQPAPPPEPVLRAPAPPPPPTPAPPPPLADTKPSLEELETQLRLAEAELRRTEEQIRRTTKEMLPHVDALVQYRQELVKAWEDGALTPFEETHLKAFRTQHGVTIEEHNKLTKEVQFESYLRSFREAWSSGAIAPDRPTELSDLRRRFLISPEESDALEAEILWEVRAGAQRSTLVVIDDDLKFLNIVTETLREANFNVRGFSTSDDAFRFLKENVPDMIISDINLETSTMGGFTFYEKIRELDHLVNVPFIFLSGLTDEVLIRTGKELGVDDYLTKPFSDETLLATIKGKLKRFKKLSQLSKKK
jgi:CheY-like chemotaxis protein